MTEPAFDRTLDASGLNCPMPVVKARQEIASMSPGETLKIVSTDRGSMADFEGWSRVDRRIELVEQRVEGSDDDATYVHFLRRTA